MLEEEEEEELVGRQQREEEEALSRVSVNSAEDPHPFSVCAFIVLSFAKLCFVYLNNHSRTTMTKRARVCEEPVRKSGVEVYLPVGDCVLIVQSSGIPQFQCKSLNAQAEEELDRGLQCDLLSRKNTVCSDVFVLLAGGAPPNQSVGRLGGGTRNQGHRCVTPREEHRALGGSNSI